MEYLTLFLISLACGAVGVVGYTVIIVGRKTTHQLRLVSNILQLNSQDIKTLDHKLESVRKDQIHTSEQHRKSVEHNRVLLASLNRQLNRLEEMLEPVELVAEPPRQYRASSPAMSIQERAYHETHVEPAPQPVPVRETRVESAEKKKTSAPTGTVRLEDMFRQRPPVQLSENSHVTPEVPAVETPENSNASHWVGIRRVANG